MTNSDIMNVESVTPVTLWQNEDAMAILIRLYENNPLKIDDLRKATDIRDDKILSIVSSLAVWGLVKTDVKLREFRITPSGKSYIESIGITKEEIAKEKYTAMA